MDTYSQIYIKSNFQDPTFCWFWAGKCQKLLIFKADDFASKIAKNAFWRSFCSWKTPISWLVTIKWPLQTPMLVVVLMMINPIFLMLKSAILKLCQWIQFEFLHCFKRRLLRSFCALPARAERLHDTEVWDQKQPILRLFASPTYLWKRPHFEAVSTFDCHFWSFFTDQFISNHFSKSPRLSFWGRFVLSPLGPNVYTEVWDQKQLILSQKRSFSKIVLPHLARTWTNTENVKKKLFWSFLTSLSPCKK